MTEGPTKGRAVRLRDGAPEDADAVMVVHRRAILGLGPPFYTEVECESWAAAPDPRRYREAMTVLGERYILAETGPLAAPRLVGFASRKTGSGRLGEIAGLYVIPDYSRRGIATRLLEAVEASLAHESRGSIAVTAAMPAVPFYAARRYRATKARRWTTRGGLEIHVLDMLKDRPV